MHIKFENNICQKLTKVKNLNYQNHTEHLIDITHTRSFS